MRFIFDLLFGPKLGQQADRYVDELASSSIRKSREEAAKLLRTLASLAAPLIILGKTSWGDLVRVPLLDLVCAIGLITGGSGTGKSSSILNVVRHLIALMIESISGTANSPNTFACPGFGLIDCKGDTFAKTLFLLTTFLQDLERTNPLAAFELRRRVEIIDFSAESVHPLRMYNILARWPGADLDFFCTSRADLLMELLPAGDGVSVGGNALLKNAIYLLAENGLPLTKITLLFNDEIFRAELIRRSKNPEVQLYFRQQLAPKQTIAAVSRRVSALLSSECVRVALNGVTAPDFCSIQDSGGPRIVLVNCFGRNLSRSVRQLLQSLIVADITQSVFARRRHDRNFCWILEEAQQLFATGGLRDNLSDLLALGRGFGSHFILLTQALATAAPPQALTRILTNAKWILAFRGEPGDNLFIKSALPATGRKPRPRTNPFDDPGFYTVSEERAIELDTLPDRDAFFWLRTRSPEALKITTQTISFPQGEALEQAIEPLRGDPAFGGRMSRADYEEAIAQRDQEWAPKVANVDLAADLAAAYRRANGEEV